MLGLLILLLVIWLLCIFVGAIIKGLIWLLVIGIVLFLLTGVYGFIKRETFGRRGR